MTSKISPKRKTASLTQEDIDRIRARWAIDVDELMPMDEADLEQLRMNTVVQIWLRRFRKRRDAVEELNRKKTGGALAALWKAGGRTVMMGKGVAKFARKRQQEREDLERKKREEEEETLKA